MGILERVAADRHLAVEQRVIGGVPWRPWDSPWWKFDTGGPIHPTRAFYGVDEALRLIPVYAAVRLIADLIASLPLKMYLEKPDGSSKLYTGPSIFTRPAPETNLYDWIFECLSSLLLHGNAWGYILGRDSYGYPTGIQWMAPEVVTVIDDESQPFNPLRSRVYFYGRQMNRDEYFHIKAFAVPGRTEAISPLRAFALTILNGLEATRFGTDWFRSGGFPPGTFKNNEIEIDPTQSAEIRAILTRSIRNHEPLVYGRDWDYHAVTVPPSEAQFIEAMQLNATQIAAVYGLPGERIGGTRANSLTYCVDGETEILTRRGWLTYQQVTDDDTCLTLNTDTGLAEWQPVLSVDVFKDGPYAVTRMENGTHSSVTTPNHRWPVMLAGRTGGNGWVWRTTETLPTDARICAAAPVVALSDPKWSDALVELVAWFWTEGWHNEWGSVVLAQSDAVNPQNVARIRAALTEVFGPSGELYVRAQPSWREDRDERGLIHFRLNAKAGRVLLEHAPDKVVTTQFLSELTRAQLELFYQVSIDADGWRRWGNRAAGMGQKGRARLDAFQVACALTGRSGVVLPDAVNGWRMSVQVTPWRKPRGHVEYVTQETTPLVWCVQTPNRTWFARRNGTCYFTGNTNVEQSTLQVIEAIRPWLVRLETAFFDILPANRYVRFNADALLRTDLQTRANIYKVWRDIGFSSVDEMREGEDRPPLPNGIGADNIPLDAIIGMSRSVRAVPNSILPQVTLEARLALEYLEELQNIMPAQSGPGTAGGVPIGEKIPGPVQPAPGQPSAPPESPVDLLTRLVSAVRSVQAAEHAGLVRKARGIEPEFLGPWIPDARDVVLNGSNGNGQH